MKTTYKVVGTTPFDNHQPGETFEADLDPFIEQWAKDNDLIKPVPKKEVKKDG